MCGASIVLHNVRVSQAIQFIDIHYFLSSVRAINITCCHKKRPLTIQIQSFSKLKLITLKNSLYFSKMRN